MYSNNIMPNYGRNIQRRGFGFGRRNDRILGGGFAVPFILGGITGGLLSRPNNFYGYQPYPVPFVVNTPYPYYSNNYYYY